MFVTKEYDRTHAQEYALRWALDRNPLFTDFAEIGGDCTNFISQCILAGSCIMNFTPDFGWYYISPDDRAAAWTGVTYLYNFLTGNTGDGPFGREVGAGSLDIGDVIQLGNAKGNFYHTLIVTGFNNDTYLVCAHNDDSRNRPLNTYRYARARFIHISGVRFETDYRDSCFMGLYTGTSLSDL